MAKKTDRVRRDQAGIGPDPDAARRHTLVSMHDLDGYAIADGEPDIRGWDVRTLNGREVGEIHDLLVDTERGEVVMVEVEMRDGGLHAEVPIRSVQLDREGRSVIVDSSDIDARDDQRPRDRLRAVERSDDVRDARSDAARTLTYGTRGQDIDAAGRARDDSDEVVVERRPVIEEVVVRRRVVDEDTH